MSEKIWSREDLSAFVQGRTLYLRDPQALNAPVPDWLADVAGGVGDLDSHEAVEAVHPDDRPALIEAFLAAVAAPGVPCSVPIRREDHGTWGHYEVAWVNQLDNPDVSALIGAELAVDGPPIAPPQGGDAGGHSPTNWMLLELDDAGHIIDAKGPVHAALGYEPDELLQRPPTDFIHPDSVGDSIALWMELRRQPGATSSSRRRWVRKDGSEMWLESSYLNEVDAEGRSRILVVVWDIGERIEQEQELEESRSRFRQLAAQNEALAADFRLLADEVPTAVFRCDSEGWVIFHNSRWSDLVPTGSTGSRLHEVVHPDDHPALDTALDATRPGEGYRHPVELRHRDGRGAWRITLRSVHAGEADQRGIVGSMEDVTATLSLRRRAELDALTGLLNRGALEERLADAMDQQRPGTWVLFLDLDRFKGVNDEFGHAAGDSVLVDVAHRLRDVVRPVDHVARFGGDEFVILSRDLTREAAATLSDRIEAALSVPFTFAGGRWQLAASVGRAEPEPGESAAEVLRRADLLMFEVKRSRRAVPPVATVASPS